MSGEGFPLGFERPDRSPEISDRLGTVQSNAAAITQALSDAVIDMLGPAALQVRSSSEKIRGAIGEQVNDLKARHNRRKAKLVSSVAADAGRIREGSLRRVRETRERLGIPDDRPAPPPPLEPLPTDGSENSLPADPMGADQFSGPPTHGVEANETGTLDAGSLASGVDTLPDLPEGAALPGQAEFIRKESAPLFNDPAQPATSEPVLALLAPQEDGTSAIVGADGELLTAEELEALRREGSVVFLPDGTIRQPNQAPGQPTRRTEGGPSNWCQFPPRTARTDEINEWVQPGRTFPAGHPLEYLNTALSDVLPECRRMCRRRLQNWLFYYQQSCRQHGEPISMEELDAMYIAAIRAAVDYCLALTVEQCTGVPTPPDTPGTPPPGEPIPEIPGTRPEHCPLCGCLHSLLDGCCEGGVCPTQPMPGPVPLPTPQPGDEVPPEPELSKCERLDIPADEWIVWWSPTEARCIVTKCPEEPSGEDWRAVSHNVDRAIAQSEAAQYCQATNPQIVNPLAQWFSHQPGGNCGLDYYIQWFRTFGPASEATSDFLSQMFGLEGDDQEQWWLWSLLKFWEWPNEWAKLVATGAAYIVKQVEKVLVEIVNPSGCNSHQFTNAMLWRILYGFLSRYVSPEVMALATPYRYLSGQACPMEFPSHGEAIAAFLAGEIDNRILESWLRINNKCPQPYEPIIKAARTKFDRITLTQLRLRGLIDGTKFNEEMRALGYINPDEADMQWALREQFPPYQDLIRFMVRDADDNDVASTFDLDADFTKKFGPNIRRYAEQQGIPSRVMQMAWRAHWIIPSPNQLFDMLHRLRPGRVAADVTTEWDEVEMALKTQDIPEFWIKRFREIAFRPLTRVDVRRMFDIGAIDRDEVKEAYLDLGYDEKRSEQQVEFAEKLQERAFANHPANAQFVRGELSFGEWTEEMNADNVPSHVIEKLDKKLRGQRLIPRRNACTKALKKRFLMGEFSQDQVMMELEATGWAGDYVPNIIDAWRCEQSAMSKQAPVGTLCRWLERGIITGEDFHDRLVRIGWSMADARRVLVDCMASIDIKRRKEAEKLAKQLKAEADKQDAEAKRARNEAARNERQLQTRAERLQRANDKRDKALLAASEKWSKYSEIDLDVAYDEIKAIWEGLTAETPLSLDERVQAIVTSVEAITKGADGSLEARVAQAAQVLLDLEGGPQAVADESS